MKTGKLIPVLSTEVEYYCPACDAKFVVYHQNDDRNTNCLCGSPVKLTGVSSKIEGGEIVTSKDGVEISRKKRPGT